MAPQSPLFQPPQPRGSPVFMPGPRQTSTSRWADNACVELKHTGIYRSLGTGRDPAEPELPRGLFLLVGEYTLEICRPFFPSSDYCFCLALPLMRPIAMHTSRISMNQRTRKPQYVHNRRSDWFTSTLLFPLCLSTTEFGPLSAQFCCAVPDSALRRTVFLP